MQKVLALFANPRYSSQLRLGEEDRTIRECFRRGRMRDTIELVVRHAATVDDVRRALLDDEFTIVHFSGHGTQSGLLFEDRDGGQYVPPQDALADLLAEYAPPLTCAVLNACYSLTQGEFTSVRLPYTIAMESPIADPSAIKFTEAFYDSIAAGKDAEFSYRQGVHALRLANDPNYAVPVLLHQGETWRPPQSFAVPPAASREVEQSATERETIIGVALDVSGSMEGSFDNRSTDMSSRLETVRASLGRKLDARTLRAASAQTPPVRIFCYAFGLRDGGTCDLFSMLKAAEDVINREEIDRLADQYARELRAEYSSGGVGDLGSLAKSFGLGSFMKAAEEIGRNQVKQRVTAEVQRRLRARMRGMGDTTLTLEEFAGFWKGSSGSLADAEPLIYGNTPMCQALRALVTVSSGNLSRFRERIEPPCCFSFPMASRAMGTQNRSPPKSGSSACPLCRAT